VPPTTVAAAMFSGETVYKASTTTGMPFVALGLADFSMEWFVKGRTVNSFSAFETEVHSGLVTPRMPDTGGDIQNGLEVSDRASASNLEVTVVTGVSAQFGVVTSATEWTHIALSVARAADATLYVNGSVDSTADASSGSGTDFPAVPVRPLMGQGSSPIIYDSLTNDDDDVDSAQCYLSSFAIHNRQLTPTEVSDAFAAKVVNNLSGATFVRYLFSRFVDSVGTPVTVVKETTPANISLGCKDRIAEPQNSELFVPIATPDTLFIEDTSGNGGHWPLLTQTSYGSGTLADRGICGFATTGAS
jgi:hypothetical protein